jgi:GntR family transcriptional repressor for pyruvate dehydrogenase complex
MPRTRVQNKLTTKRRKDVPLETETFSPVQKQQLVDQVMIKLRQMIASGRFAVGDRLPSEPQLMKMLGVGRTTTREAIRVLAHCGIVQVQQGSGTFVRSISDTSADSLTEKLRGARVQEVYQVRRALDVEVVRLAALNRDQNDLAKIRAILVRLDNYFRSDERDSFREANIELYAAFALSSKNNILVDLYRSFAQSVRDAISQLMVFPGVMKACLARHKQVYAAMVKKDWQTAVSVDVQFLERMSSLIDDLLDDDGHDQRHSKQSLEDFAPAQK